MNRLSNLFIVSIIALGALISGCGQDNPIEPLGPTLSLVPGVNAVTDTATVAPSDTFLVQINATQGDAALTRIEVREDGSAMAASRLILDGFEAQSNPSPLASTDQLDWTIEIIASEFEGISEYTIIVTDENGNDASTSVEITTEIPAPITTPATTREMIMLFNQGGPVGTGGLDLDAGIGTGSADTTAEIRDMGIDLNLPLDQNWLQQIAAVNTDRGVVLKAAADGTVWDDITTLEDIAAAFDLGTEIADQSDRVELGDIFFVVSGRGVQYALVVTQINITPDNNDDNYHFDVKGP